MKAVAIVEVGAPAQMVEVQTPSPAAGEIRVRLHVAGLNPADGKGASGAFGEVVVPYIPGFDGAGVVDMVGEETHGFVVGDAVFGRLGRPGRGTFAEYVVTPESGVVARLPEGLDFASAAAIPVAGLTALGVLQELALSPGRRLLIIGATGGVGSFLTQLAARDGLEVIATARPELAERMRGFGARATIDHTSSATLVDQLRSLGLSHVDALVDLVGDRRLTDALISVLTPGGKAVSTAGGIDPEKSLPNQISGSSFRGRPTAEMLEELGTLVASKQLTIPIERELSLAEGPQALEESRRGHLHGKTVLWIVP